MLMPVQQNSFTHLRVLLVLTDRSIWPDLTSVVDGRVILRWGEDIRTEVRISGLG